MKVHKSVQMTHEEFVECMRKDRLHSNLLVGGVQGVAGGAVALAMVASGIALYHGQFLQLAQETMQDGIPFWIWSPYLGLGLAVGLIRGYAQYQKEEDERRFR
jgi:hypothetical protein